MSELSDGHPTPTLMGHLEDGLCRLEAAYPKVYRHIELALGQLADARVSGEFQTVGISCRDAFITFAEQVFSPDFSKSASSVHKEQTNIRIELTLRHYGKEQGTHRLKRLVKDVQAQAQSLQHNRAASRESAWWVLFYSTAALIELSDLMEAATGKYPLQRRYGHVICPECHSTDLYEESIGSKAKTRVLGCNIPMCSHLGWPKGFLSRALVRDC